MDNYCVFGNPIEHSRSPFIHKKFAQQTKQKLNYHKQFVELDNFTHAVKKFIANGGKGANVTLPFKEQALALCDQLSEAAKQAGAVNTLSFVDDKIIGDNTDGIGLVKDLIRNRVKLENKNILLLGAGGAARGVILPLLQQNPRTIIIANRTESKAKALCTQFDDKRLNSSGLHNIPSNNFAIVINATSGSLTGERPDIAEKLINKQTICYDMVYAAQLTSFLVWAKKLQAAKVIDGLGMLVGQAAVSFTTWRNVQPEQESVIALLRTALEQDEK